MIGKLYIRNYLIIKEIEIDFNNGLNILTGETGAGKSIILDALSLVLGERADYSLINKEQEKLIVEGHFNFKGNKGIKNLLEEILAEDTVDIENIIVRRELLKKGVSRNFINDSPVNISEMKKFGDVIIDIHSQNEHQSLLNKETHIEILDNYAGNEKLFLNYKNEFRELSELIHNYYQLISKKEELISKKSFLDFQLKEINNQSLSPDEDVMLESELKKLENVEDISTVLNTSIKALYENEFSAFSLISSAIKELKKVAEYDKNFERIIEDLENSYILVKESSEYLNSYQSELNFDNDRIEQIRERMSNINHLKKRYNRTVEELIEKAKSIETELSLAENFDYETEQQLKKINLKREIVFKIAQEIFELRTKKIKELERGINLLFKEVGLESAEFKVDIKNTMGTEDDMFSYKKGKEYYKLGNSGYSHIEFLIMTNKGTGFSALRKSTSGGEISRIMLVIKTVLSEKDNIPILVFDEIDAGISGKIAQKVGKILKTLSESHQIICITHLPQIAAMSERHFHVSKKEKNNETIAEIKTLTNEEKVLEIAKLISGERVTDASTKSALELIKS